jgi:hypothetical protein
VKLVIANNYGEEDQIARHTFYANRTQSNATSTDRRLSCHIVSVYLYRLKIIIYSRKQPLNDWISLTGRKEINFGKYQSLTVLDSKYKQGDQGPSPPSDY